MSGQLQAPHRDQLHEVAEVEARRGRVEAAVEGDRAGGQCGAQRIGIGAVRDQPAPGEVVEDLGGHGPMSIWAVLDPRGLPCYARPRCTLTAATAAARGRLRRSPPWRAAPLLGDWHRAAPGDDPRRLRGPGRRPLHRRRRLSSRPTPAASRIRRQLEHFELSEGSRVASADGVELATFAAEQRRVIPFAQIPKVMIDAQVAAEDRTFWTNPCIDFRGIVRAALQNFSASRTVSGASTICQQLVRIRLFDADLLTNAERRWERKIKEAILALRVGDRYPGTEGKQKLLEMYLNQVYYGNNVVRHLGRRQSLPGQGHHLVRPRGPADHRPGGPAGGAGARPFSARSHPGCGPGDGT